MQLLHENTTLQMMKDINMSAKVSLKNISSSLDVKDKRSSAALILMNPVASGDNVATGLSSAHKLKEEPSLVPCCEGKELQINEELVRSGLSAISVKHDGLVQCLSMSHACERMAVQPGLVKHRNSFRCLHRPDLKRVPYLRRMTPAELENLFKGYGADIQRGHDLNKDNRTKIALPPCENSQASAAKPKPNFDDAEGAAVLHPIPETRSEDVPVSMRLHGARARIYTSVLAGVKGGDQLDGISTTEYDNDVPHEVHEDEEQIHEELQIILPPRCDDVTADSSVSNASDNFSESVP